MILYVQRNTVFHPNGIYHIYSRGNRKDIIFPEPVDCERFVDKLWTYTDVCKMMVSVYCLMRNHFHLLVIQWEECSVSNLMQRVNLSHAKYINLRYDKVGHVFQGRFGSREISDDEDEINMLRYICHNPVKEGYVERWSDYRWLWINETRYRFPEDPSADAFIVKKPLLS